VYKSDSLADMRQAGAAMSAILDLEMGLHVEFCAGWGLDEVAMAATPEATHTLAYTRYVLERGMAGDLLDLHVALAPCVIGYAEIGRKLAPNGANALGAHPYRDWIGEYAGDAYQEVAIRARRHLDDLAARAMTEQRFVELAGLFGKASRLEADFWQMGLAALTPSR
jgi:thiaminase (transcriptional activator TenA)